jgi:hypothetical protein
LKKILLIILMLFSCFQNKNEINLKQQKAVDPACTKHRNKQQKKCSKCLASCAVSEICLNVGSTAHQMASNAASAAGATPLEALLYGGIAQRGAEARCSTDIGSNDCKQKCRESPSCMDAGTECPAVFFDVEDIIDDLIDFEVFGDEGEEILDAVFEIDGFPLDNDSLENYVDTARNVTRVENLIPGSYEITVRAAGYGVRSMRINVVGTPGVTQSVRMVLRPGSSVSGVVQWNNGTDHPIEDARVMLVSFSDNTKDYATTNGSGVFEFPGVSAGSYRVVVAAEGYTMKEIPVFVTDGETKINDLEITYPSSGNAGTISGAVTYNNILQEGVPVRIALSDLTSSRGLVPLDLENQVPYIEVITNRYGEFKITNAPRELITIGAFSGNLIYSTGLDLKNNKSLENIKLELHNGSIISGIAKNGAQSPLENIEITGISIENFSPDYEIVLDLPRVAVTDEHGAFSLNGLPYGNYGLYAIPAKSRDFSIFSRPAIVTNFAGNEDVVMEIKDNGSISGTIACNHTTEEIVACLSFDRFQIGISEDSLVTFSGTENEFKIPNLAPGIYKLFVRGEYFSSLELENIEVVAGKDTDLGNILVRSDNTMKKLEGHIEGQIVDANYNPVEGAFVSYSTYFSGDGIFIHDNFPVKTIMTDKEGYFSLIVSSVENIISNHVLVPDLYAIVEYGNFRSQPVLIDGQSIGTILVNPMGSLEGTIECNSAPIPALIKVESFPDRRLSLVVSTHSDGYYKFDRLAPGNYRVSVIPTVSVCGMDIGIEIASDEITIVSDDTKDISLNIYNSTPAVADAGIDQVVYNNDPVTLDGTGSLSANSYQWFVFDIGTVEFVFVDDKDKIDVAVPELDESDIYLLLVTDTFGAQSGDVVFVSHEEEP